MGTMEQMYMDELITGRKALLESCRNMDDVASYCEENYVEAKDKKRALQETKNYTIQSLASVAYQINTLATSMLQVLDYTTIQLEGMDSSLNNIDLTIDLHREKVGREEFKSLQTSKAYERTRKLTKPEQLPKNPGHVEYLSKPIDYSSLDSIGHGMKLGLSGSSPRSSRTSSVSSTVSSSSSGYGSRQVSPQKESLYFGSLRQPKTSSRPTVMPTVPGTYSGRRDAPRNQRQSVLSTAAQSTLSGVSNGGPPKVHSPPPPAPPPPPSIVSQPSTGGSGAVDQSTHRVPGDGVMQPPPPSQISALGGVSDIRVTPPQQTSDLPPPPSPHSMPPPQRPISMPPPPSPLTLDANSSRNSFLGSPSQTDMPPPPSPLEETPKKPTLRRKVSKSPRPKSKPPPPPVSIAPAAPPAPSQGPSIPAPPPAPPLATPGGAPPPPPPPPPIGGAAIKKTTQQASTTQKPSNKVPSKPQRGFAEQLQLRMTELRSQKENAENNAEQPRLKSSSNGSLPPSTTKARHQRPPSIGITPAVKNAVKDAPLSPPPEFVRSREPDWAPREYLSKVVAVYDYTASRYDEMTFQEGDVIYVTTKNEDGWLEGVLNGVTAMLPGNYVEKCS